MRGRRWHAPQAILVLVLGVTVVGTLLVGLLLGSAPPAEAPALPVAGEPTMSPLPSSGTPSSTLALPTRVDQMPGAIIRPSRQGFRQRTLLLMARGADGQVSNAVLLATSDERQPASALLIPPSVLVPTPSWTPLAQTATSPDTLLARNAVSMLLGVRIDASVTLDRLALAAVVDAIGGIPADVERPLTVLDAGKEVVSIPAGSRVLDGVSASDYAMAMPVPGMEFDRISRFTEVLRSILLDLPEEPEALRQLVLSLGSLAKSTQTNEQVVAILRDLGRDARAGDMRFQALPVVAIRGDGLAQVDLARAREIILEVLPDAVLQPGESPGIRVLVSAAGATPSQVAVALARLQADGFTVIESDAAPIALPGSAVLVQDASPVARAMGLDVAEALGLLPRAVRIDGGANPSPDVVVWLGRDAPTLAPGSQPGV